MACLKWGETGYFSDLLLQSIKCLYENKTLRRVRIEVFVCCILHHHITEVFATKNLVYIQQDLNLLTHFAHAHNKISAYT
jgi:hypothetical protein